MRKHWLSALSLNPFEVREVLQAILLVGGTLLVMIVTVSLVYGAFSGTLDPNSILGTIVGWMGEIAKAFFIDIN